MRFSTHRLFAGLRVLFAALLLGPLLAHATMVRLYTSLGPIDVALLDSAAPLSVQNFLAYVQSGAYASTFIHRAPKNFVVQGGGYTVTATGVSHIPTRGPIALECSADRPNVRGTVAMARTSVRDSATSEWFVNTVDNSFLNCSPTVDGYAVFGRVTPPTLAAVDAIAALPVATRLGFTDLPLFTVRPIPATGSGVQASDLVYINSAVVLPTPPGDSDRAFNYIEAAAWQFLKPPASVSGSVTLGGVNYYYRYYPTSDSYIAVADSQVLYLVPAISPNITRYSSLAEIMVEVNKAGY